MTEAFKKTPITLDEHYGQILKALRRGVGLTASAGGRANTMTISWGMLGFEWNYPVFITYVRTGRFTHGLLERNPEFSVNIPVGDYPARLLGHLGTRSGHNEDKVAALGLHTVPGNEISAPGLAELPLTLECRILYRRLQQSSDFLPDPTTDAILRRDYPQDVPSTATGSNRDFHTAFYGEIVGAHLIEPA